MKNGSEVQVNGFKNYLKDILYLLKLDQDIVGELFKFEEKMAKLSKSREERRDQEKLYNPSTIGDLPSGKCKFSKNVSYNFKT